MINHNMLILRTFLVVADQRHIQEEHPQGVLCQDSDRWLQLRKSQDLLQSALRPQIPASVSALSFTYRRLTKLMVLMINVGP